jgi:hypothetical protein
MEVKMADGRKAYVDVERGDAETVVIAVIRCHSASV